MARSSQSRKSFRKPSNSKNAVRLLSPSQVLAAVKTMSEPAGTARFRAGKLLSLTAEKYPERIYPHFNTIAALLETDSKIVCWNAMQILSLLAPVDKNQKLDPVVDSFLGQIRGKNLISAANAIRGLGRIARERPDLLDRIVPGILAVEKATYATPECRNVAIGHALAVFEELWPSMRDRAKTAGFVRRQRSNTRQAVARCAERMAAELL